MVVISSVRYSFGYLERISGHFRGRIVVGDNVPIVRQLRQDKIFRTAASNMVSVGRLDVKNAEDLKLNFQRIVRTSACFRYFLTELIMTAGSARVI